MAKAAQKTKTATSTRAKALGRADSKRPPAVSALGAEATAYLNKLKRKAERGVALTAAQKADVRGLEAQREARNAYTRWLRQKGKAKATVTRLGAAIETLEAEVAKAAATGATPAATQTLSKAELIGGIKVALTIATDEGTRKGLEMALELARKLEG